MTGNSSIGDTGGYEWDINREWDKDKKAIGKRDLTLNFTGNQENCFPGPGFWRQYYWELEKQLPGINF